MVEFNIENLLSEINPDTPCGEDISYDQAYMALEVLVGPKQSGGGVLGQEEAVEEPNWREVHEKSNELLGRSKDLRVATFLAVALLKLNGIQGLSDGLSLLEGLLERFWDHVYPQLDPDDDNDPLERINILQSLSPPSFDQQDPIKLKQRLCEVPLCSSPSMGRFCYRDVQIAKGEITAAGDQASQVPEMSVIDAAFQDTPTHELEATLQAIEDAIERAAAIVNVFSERASQAQSPNLSDLETLLAHIRKFVQGYLAKRGLAGPVEDTEMASADRCCRLENVGSSRRLLFLGKE